MEAPADAPSPPAGLLARFAARLPRTYVVGRRVLGRSFRDGYIHAGNIAYLSLVTLLPLIILITAVTSIVGQTDAGQAAIATFLAALPPSVAELFEPVIDEVIGAQAAGTLLGVGALVALWTVTTFIETVRDMIHRAFGVPPYRNFLQNRLRSMGGTLAAILLVVIGFILQLVLVLVAKAMVKLFPYAEGIATWIDISRYVPPIAVFLSLWALFKLLSPKSRRHATAWPGALVTTLAWVSGSMLLGPVLSLSGGMSLTYGTLSGVMIALLFFYAVGFALVIGAELNAALANPESAN